MIADWTGGAGYCLSGLAVWGGCWRQSEAGTGAAGDGCGSVNRAMNDGAWPHFLRDDDRLGALRRTPSESPPPGPACSNLRDG